jgi:hypothetical protein
VLTARIFEPLILNFKTEELELIMLSVYLDGEENLLGLLMVGERMQQPLQPLQHGNFRFLEVSVGELLHIDHFWRINFLTIKDVELRSACRKGGGHRVQTPGGPSWPVPWT